MQKSALLLLIALAASSLTHAFVDARGFPSQGQAIRNSQSIGQSPTPQNMPRGNPNQNPNVIINQYQVYPYVGDYYDNYDENDNYLPDTFFDTESINNDDQPQANQSGQWVTATDGTVPANAIVYKYVNGDAVYRCRSQGTLDYYYGVLVAGRGCYVNNDTSTTIYNNYDVLVAN